MFFSFGGRTRDEVYKACGAKRIGWESEDDSADEDPEFGSSSIDAEEEYRLLRLAADYLMAQVRRFCRRRRRHGA